MPLGPLPSPGPFGRIVDVRVFPHGFSTEQGDIVRPNIEDAAWHADAGKWGGNIVWTGSTPRHTVAYNGPRGRYFGALTAGSFVAMDTFFAYNGAKIDGPSGRVLAACVKTYASLPTSQTYTGTGDGTLTMQDPATAAGALTGDYEVRCIEAGATPRFLVTGPDGQPVGVAEAGSVLGGPVLFDGVLRFTLQSGGIAFAVGDAWIVTAEEAEQFVVIVTPFVDSTPRTETVWRRGVSLTPGSSWKQIGSVAPVSAQVNGSIQPWFINASATRAVTCRGLGEDASGYTNGVVGRTLNLDTLAVSDTPQQAALAEYTSTLTMTGSVANPSPPPDEYASDATQELATLNGGPHEQLMAQDFDGDTLVLIHLRYTASISGSIVLDADSNFENPEANRDGTNNYTVHFDLVWSSGQTLEVFDLVGSEAVHDTTIQTFDRQTTRTYRHKVLRDLSDSVGGHLAWTEYSGTETSVSDAVYYPDVATNASATLTHTVGAAEVSTGTGSSGPHISAGVAGDSTWGFLFLRPGGDVWTVETSVGVLAGVGALGAAWALDGVVSANVAAGALPSVNTTTGRGFQTSAQDTRGNWLMAAEIAAFGTTDMRFPGQISASGTYTLQAGGPDALTAAQVASLTAYAPHDRWDIGAF